MEGMEHATREAMPAGMAGHVGGMTNEPSPRQAPFI